MYNLGTQAKAALEQGRAWIEEITHAERVLHECSAVNCSYVLPG